MSEAGATGRMPARGPRAVAIAPTTAERRRLRRWADGELGPAVGMRAAVILACASGSPNAAVAARVGVSVPTVRKWRGRFARSGPAGLLEGAAPRPSADGGRRGGARPAGQAPSHLWETVARALRGEILRGELAPGERLGEAEIAARLETSRGPVREAIRELAREGLVVESARRTAVVRTPTERDLVEVYEVRHALETLAVESLVERLRPDALAALEAHLDALEGCRRRREPCLLAARHDLAFHRDLLALAGNRRASEVNGRMLVQTEHLLRAAATARPRRRIGMGRRVHRDILDALRGGDRDALRAAIDNHHREALDRLLGRDQDQKL